MIEADVGNDAQNRRNNIGAIQSPAQTDFNHGYIHLLFGEILESHSGSQFKKRRLNRFEKRFMLGYELHDKLLGSRLSVHFYPFAEIQKMRRSV